MATLYRDSRTFFGVEDETWMTLALWSIISIQGISYNINRILNFLLEEPVIWDSAVFAIVSAVFILLGTVSGIKRMERREFLLMLLIGTIWFLSYVFNERVRGLLSGSYFTPMLIKGFSGILCIAHYNNWERFRKVGTLFTIIGIVTFLLRSWIVINEENAIDYMAFSYANLVFIIAAFWLAIHRNNILMWIAAPISLVTVMLVGSRGALLSVLVYILLEFLLSKKIHPAAKVAFFAFVTVIYLNLDNIMLWLDGILSEVGYNSRTLRKFFEGTLQDDSGRSNYYKYAWEIAVEHPIIGCGMAGSVPLLFEKIHGMPAMGSQGAYAHNLFLDLLMHYGLFVGFFMIIWFILHLSRAYIKTRNTNAGNILFFFFSLIIPRLMVSGTYLSYPEFFIFLGLLLNLNYEKNKQPLEDIVIQ